MQPCARVACNVMATVSCGQRTRPGTGAGPRPGWQSRPAQLSSALSGWGRYRDRPLPLSTALKGRRRPASTRSARFIRQLSDPKPRVVLHSGVDHCGCPGFGLGGGCAARVSPRGGGFRFLGSVGRWDGGSRVSAAGGGAGSAALRAASPQAGDHLGQQLVAWGESQGEHAGVAGHAGGRGSSRRSRSPWARPVRRPGRCL